MNIVKINTMILMINIMVLYLSLPESDVVIQDSVIESDEQVFSRACPEIVNFCKEWKEKWAQDADPEIRNQTIRECVVDMMSKKTGEPWS